MKSFSPCNMLFMRAFAEGYQDKEKVKQLVSQLPWGHVIRLIQKDRKGLIAEYAMKDISKPVGVSEYQLLSAIPEELKGSLPTIEELEAELADKRS